MRLAAIFIPKGVLTHIFGDDHKDYTVNLGGKYLYELSEINSVVKIKEKVENPNFIEDFWGENISLVSAVVGANGTGKTTLLNVFKNTNHCSFIYEEFDNNKYVILDEIDGCHSTIYYSPFLNIQYHDFENRNFEDISIYPMMLNDTEYENIELSAQLELYNSENLKRWIKFRRKEGIANFLKDIQLPVFDNIKIKFNHISVKNHDTSYAFRRFFEKFQEIKSIENDKRFKDLGKRKGIKIPNGKRTRDYGNKIRLELLIIERVINKVHSILESSGNKYLNEGFIKYGLTVDSAEFKSIEGLKNSFYWFIENSYIQLTPESEKVFLPVSEIKGLVEILISDLPEDEEIENWAELNVDFDKTFKILGMYEKFLLSFKEYFTFDKKILLTIGPDKNLSSGEKGMYNLFASFFDYQFKKDNFFEEDYYMVGNERIKTNNYLILIDEGDMGFHPQWKKRFVKSLIEIFSQIFPDKKLQIIFTTHDPLTLSDIPNKNIVFLDINKETGFSHVLNKYEAFLKRTFGANIHDLLADSFFLKNGFMGEFAEEYILDLINYLTNEENKVKTQKSWNEKKAQQIISIVDEPIIKERLQELFDKKFIFNNNEDLELRIKRLESELKKLNNEKG